MRTAFYVFLTVLFSLILIAVGIFLMALPSAPHFRQHLVAFLQEEALTQHLVGAAVVLLGVFFILSCYLFKRKERMLVIGGEGGKATISEEIVLAYLTAYFKSLFKKGESD